MPTYPYHCICGHAEDVVKPISMYNSPEPCPTCGALMDKDWGQMVPAIHAFQGHFSQALGCYVGNKQQQDDACSRIEEKTGSRPIPIGDYKPVQKPIRKEYEIPRGIFDG